MILKSNAFNVRKYLQQMRVTIKSWLSPFYSVFVRYVLSTHINQTIFWQCWWINICVTYYISVQIPFLPFKVTREMETDRQSLVYPVRKQTILREKKKFPRSDHRFMFFCLFIINLLTVAALLKIYQSNQYLNELTVITQNLKSDVENTANLHRLLLTKLQESDRRDKLVDVLKTFNSTSNKTRMNLSVRNWEKLETTAGISCSSIKDNSRAWFRNS